MSEEKFSFHVAFPIPDELRDKTMDMIEFMRESDSKQADAHLFVDVVEVISDTGLKFFFLDPIQKTGMGPVAYRTVEVTLISGKKAVLAVARRLVKRMSDKQIMDLVEFVGSVIFDFEIEE